MKVICFAFLVLCCFSLFAEGSSKPILRLEFVPKNEVLVGQPITLNVDIFVPTYFGGSPELPTLNIPGAIIVLNQTGVNLTEQFGNESWAGIRRTYVIYPQEPHEFKLPAAEITVPYAAVPGKPPVSVKLTLPPKSFKAKIPPEAAGLDYFLATIQFTIKQELQMGSKVKVGDSIHRTIIMTANKTYSMFIPPVHFDPIKGLAVYPDPPKVADNKTDRGEFIAGERIESAHYVIQKEGDYVLPSVTIVWWNLGAGKMEKTTLPEVTFHADPNPAAISELPPEPEPVPQAKPPSKPSYIYALKKWGALGLGVLVLLYFIFKAWKKYEQRIVMWWKQRRIHQYNSESAAFSRFESSCRNNIASEAYKNFLEWIDKTGTVHENDPPLQTFVHQANNDALNAEVNKLDSSLFGKDASTVTKWKGDPLADAMKEVRMKLLRHTNSSAANLLPPLNPPYQK